MYDYIEIELKSESIPGIMKGDILSIDDYFEDGARDYIVEDVSKSTSSVIVKIRVLNDNDS